MNLPKRLTLIEEMEYMNLARKNAGLAPEYKDDDLDYARRGIEFVLDPTNNLWRTYNQQDFIKATLRDVYTLTNNNIQISGGNEKVTYMASIGNMQQNGIFKVGEDLFSRWNARINVSAKVNDYLKFDISSAYTSQATDNPQDGGNGLEGGGNSIFRQMYNSRLRFPILILTEVIISVVPHLILDMLYLKMVDLIETEKKISLITLPLLLRI